MPAKIFKKVNCVFLSGCVMLSFFGGQHCTVAAAAQTMGLNQALTLAVANDKKLKNIKTKLAFQYIKRKKAQEGVANIRKRENTVRFSLLFNIKWPEKHGLPKELDLLTKLPQVDSETMLLQEESKDRELVVREKATKLFINIYCLQESIAATEKNLALAKQNLQKFRVGVVSGSTTPEDLAAEEQLRERNEKELTSFKQAFTGKVAKLSDMLAVDVTTYRFLNPLSTIAVPREKLDEMSDYAMAHRYDVRQVATTSQVACRKVDLIFEILRKKHGNKIMPLQSFVRAEGDINYDNFLREYEKYLYNADKPWAKVYKIWLLFFTIKIPKEWFKKEYDGTRYLEDEKYALPEAMRDRDDARAEEAATKKEIKAALVEEYEAIMVAKTSYDAALADCERLRKVYEEAKVKNMLRAVEYEEVRQAKEDYDQAQSEVQDQLENFSDLAATLDKDTCGWVSQFRSGASVLNVATSSGDSLGVSKPSYQVVENIEELQSVFSLSIPESAGIEATDYELWVDDFRVGQRKSIMEQMILLPVEIVGPKTVVVRLFNNGKFVDEAEFYGLETSGELNFKVQEAKNSQKAKEAKDALKDSLLATQAEAETTEQVGEYSIEENQIGKLALFNFSVSNLTGGAKYFRITPKDEEGKKLVAGRLTPADQWVTEPGVVFADEKEVRVELYDAGKQKLFEARLDSADGKLVKVLANS